MIKTIGKKGLIFVTSFKFISTFLIVFSGVLFLLGFRVIELYNVENFIKVLDGYLLFSSITIGFFGTCISILATLLNSPLLKDLFSKTNYKVQFAFMTLFTMFFGIGGIILTVIFQMTLDYPKHAIFDIVSQNWIESLWLVFGCNYFFGLSLVVTISMLILLQSHRESTPAPVSNYSAKEPIK